MEGLEQPEEPIKIELVLGKPRVQLHMLNSPNTLPLSVSKWYPITLIDTTHLAFPSLNTSSASFEAKEHGT